MIASLPSRLILDRSALVENWRWLSRVSGKAACGAAVKADGYGLGAAEIVSALSDAGCRDFFVATWAEALALGRLPDGAMLSVLHGVRDNEMMFARAGLAVPVLNSAAQVARWKAAGGGLCHVMVDTGMTRLGVSAADIASGLLDGLMIDTLMSHMACADEPDHPMNAKQLSLFQSLCAVVDACRYSLANSAAICLGGEYSFDLTRPGIALYGGIQSEKAEGHIRQVARLEAEILQIRTAQAGETIGYNATYTADADMRIAILNIGYADGYRRGFSSVGQAMADNQSFPVIGRVSMDLTAVDVTAVPNINEGDWLAVDYDLKRASEQSGISQYELLTGLGRRYQRQWI